MSRSIAAAFMLKARRAVLRALLGAMSLCSITTAVASVMLSACSTNDYLQQSEETYGVTDAWYRGDRRKFHHVLLAPNQLSLFDPGYIIGVEEVHPSDSSFVPSGSERSGWLPAYPPSSVVLQPSHENESASAKKNAAQARGAG